jgi:tetratricopeptide (TPR) repeat protein
LLAVTRRSDPDPWRDRLRAAFERRDRETVVKLAQDKEVLEQPPTTLLILTSTLAYYEQQGQTLDILQRAQLQHPADFWINFMLAEHLVHQVPPNHEAAIGYYRTALALRPESPGVYMNLGKVFESQHEYARAEAAYRKAIDVRPKEAAARLGLGAMLREQGKLTQAETLYREALQPNHALAGASLANLLYEQKRWSEVLEIYEHAVQSGSASSYTCNAMDVSRASMAACHSPRR